MRESPRLPAVSAAGQADRAEPERRGRVELRGKRAPGRRIQASQALAEPRWCGCSVFAECPVFSGSTVIYRFHFQVQSASSPAACTVKCPAKSIAVAERRTASSFR